MGLCFLCHAHIVPRRIRLSPVYRLPTPSAFRPYRKSISIDTPPNSTCCSNSNKTSRLYPDLFQSTPKIDRANSNSSTNSTTNTAVVSDNNNNNNRPQDECCPAAMFATNTNTPDARDDGPPAPTTSAAERYARLVWLGWACAFARKLRHTDFLSNFAI